MRVFLRDEDGIEHEVDEAPSKLATVVQFAIDCPGCNAKGPILVAGAGIERHDHDTYYARAAHVGCGARLGTLCVEVDTIFGIEEDEQVLNGRCRVY